MDQRFSALDSKLNPPVLSPSQVDRSHLLESLEGASSVRLVLLRAPAGFGKTSMMLQYRKQLEHRGVYTAWLTLDRADNDVARFLDCLASALSKAVPDIMDGASSPKAVLQVINNLGALDHPLVFFLDELEVIREPGVQSILRELIERLPRMVQVVIGTRTTPNLGLGRLRARGQLLEIDAGQLRFSLEETREYITSRRQISLDAADINKLFQKTEGWVAGLWLASAAMASHQSKAEFVGRFSGSNLEVADYLGEDVLNQQTPEVRTFLLHTSVLRTLSPDLCKALVPEVDSEGLLKSLEADNVLITRIAGEERSYRYHSLFADYLKSRLLREQPEEVARLHRIAAAWFDAHKRPVPAIDHSLEAGDFPRAIESLYAHGSALLNAGRMRLLTRWFDSFAPEILANHPRLQMMQAWAMCFTRGPWAASDFLKVNRLLNATKDLELRPHLLAIQPVLLTLMDRPDEAYLLGMKSLPHMPTGDRFADAVLLSVLADMCSAKDQSAEALRMLDQLRELETGRAGTINDMHSQAAEGNIALFEGRMQEATTRFRVAVQATLPNEARFTHGNAWAGILYAAAIYESGDIEQATALLRVYLPLAKEVGMPDHAIIGYRVLARIAFSEGDVDQTFRWLTELESIGHERKLPRVVASARLERARTQIAQGHYLAAKDELSRASDPQIWHNFDSLRLPANDVEYPALGRLRLDALQSAPNAAVSAIRRELDIAISARRMHRALKLNLMLTIALDRSGDHAEAISLLTRTLEECRREGFFRIAVDEGPVLGVLVQKKFAQARTVAINSDGAFLIWLQRLLQAFGPLPETNTAGNLPKPIDAYLSDPLTTKELKLLGMLAEGYSNKAIADKLLISDSTVRTHLRSINSKLGVGSRLQAVSAGRAFGLLP